MKILLLFCVIMISLGLCGCATTLHFDRDGVVDRSLPSEFAADDVRDGLREPGEYTFPAIPSQPGGSALPGETVGTAVTPLTTPTAMPEPSSTPTATPEPAATPTVVPTATPEPAATPTVVPTATTKPASTQTPTSTPKPAETAKDNPAATPKQVAQGDISLISVTSPVGRNEMSTVRIKGKPNTEYKIKVYYSTTASSAAGLEPKQSDGDGFVEWTWKVGPKTKAGDHRIVISGGDSKLETSFETT